MKAPFLIVGLCTLVLFACGDDARDDGPSSTPPDAKVPASTGDAASLPAEVRDAGRDASTSTARSDAAASDAATSDAAAPSSSIRLPPSNGGLDYQLGGAYAPAAGVTIVSRDRREEPAPGLYNVCYVNGFQAQPDEASFWLEQQPDLVLRDNAGKPVIDPDWDEMLLDVGSADKRVRLASIVGDWIQGCKTAGFDAVEIDNLDTYTRSGGRLKEDDAVAFIKLLSDEAHRRGLAIAQKNASELVRRKTELGTDFVVSEQCAHYDECDDYIAGYGEHVLMVEYERADFSKACKAYPGYSVVLRDVPLAPRGRAGYVFEGC